MLTDPSDPPEVQNVKLRAIADALIRRVERGAEPHGAGGDAYAQFERASLLEEQVRQRTTDLERTLELLHEANASLAAANAEAELAQSNLSEAIETVDGGFALFDARDRLVRTNSRFCAGLPDVVSRLHPGLAFARYVDLVSMSAHLSLDVSETRGSWARTRLGRHADDRTSFNVRLRGDRWLQVSEHRTASGGTVILQTDVTGLMRLEREERDRLKDAQARMVRATLDHLNQGVCIFDGGGRLVGWNRQMEMLLRLPIGRDVLGMGFPALLARLSGTLVYPRGASRRELEAWAASGGARPALAFEVTRRDGAVLAVHAEEMPDRGFVISFTDVTAERAAARALREMNETLERRVDERTVELGAALSEARRANASKTRFVAAASHDLLQPLSAAKLFVSSLEDRAGDPVARDVAAKATSALLSVEGIIDALLDISRLDSGAATLDVRTVPLRAILASLRTELTPMADARGLRLRVVDSALAVRSDPVFLRRILQNLVTNAIKYTHSGGVVVGVRRRGGAARLCVHDSGPGIAPTDQAAIFQEFRRLSPSRSGANGLGLGLAIVERACQSLGHPLGLRSAPGRGSLFHLEVEIASHEAAAPERSGPAAVPRATGLVILLVENDPGVARALTLMIEGWGQQVIHVESGEDALAILEEIGIAPDGCLLDQQLGAGMDGVTLLGCLRERHGALPARIVSADRTPELAARCAALGVELIPKPLDRARLDAFLADCQSAI